MVDLSLMSINEGSAGLFDDQSMMRSSLQLFTDFTPAFCDFSNTTRMMTADEVIAACAPPDA